MNRLARYLLLFALAFLLFLLLLAPADFITGPLATRLPGFSVQTVHGSAVAGAADGLRWRSVQVQRLGWAWQPLTLFSGWLEFRLKIDDPEIDLAGKAAIQLGQRLRFREWSGRLPLTELAKLAGQPQLPVQGVVAFALSELRLNPDGRPVSAEGEAQLQDLRVALGQPLALGDFTAQLKPAEPQGIAGVVRDNNGPLALEGAFSLMPDGRYRFTGQAAIRDADNRALRQAMRLLGPPGNDGRWALNFSGALP